MNGQAEAVSAVAASSTPASEPAQTSAPSTDSGGTGGTASAASGGAVENPDGIKADRTGPADSGDAGAKAGGGVQEEVKFDWDSWDGTEDIVPEPYRPVVKGVGSYYSKKFGDYDTLKQSLAEKDKQLESATELYNTLIETLGGEDPRIGELSKAKEELEKQHEAIQKEFNSYREQIEAWKQEEAKQWAASLAEKYPKYFTEEPLKQKLAGMLEEGFDAEDALQVLELGESAFQAAKAALSKGASSSLALDYAKLAAQSSPRPEKRDAAKVMAGSSPTQTPQRAQRTIRDAEDHRERVQLAIARNLKLMSGGGK